MLAASFQANAQYLVSFANKTHCTVHIGLVTCNNDYIEFDLAPMATYSFTLADSNPPDYMKADFPGGLDPDIVSDAATDLSNPYSCSGWSLTTYPNSCYSGSSGLMFDAPDGFPKQYWFSVW